MLFLYFANRYCILFDFDLPYCNFILRTKHLHGRHCVGVWTWKIEITRIRKRWKYSCRRIQRSVSSFMYLFYCNFFLLMSYSQVFRPIFAALPVSHQMESQFGQKKISYLWMFKLPSEIVLPFDRFHRVSGELHYLWANGRNEGKRNYFRKP